MFDQSSFSSACCNRGPSENAEKCDMRKLPCTFIHAYVNTKDTGYGMEAGMALLHTVFFWNQLVCRMDVHRSRLIL